MTVRRGRTWGAPGRLDADGQVVRTDAEAAEVVAEARRDGHPVPMLGLLGGDLCRTLGGSGDEARLRSDEAWQFPIDVGIATIDGHDRLFVAHVLAHGRGWHGRGIAIMNAQWVGDWDLGPRSHPGDGVFDISDGRLPLGDRFAARRRVRTGTHLPHPGIATSRTASFHTTFAPTRRVWVDGVPVGRVTELEVRLVPDVCTVVV